MLDNITFPPVALCHYLCYLFCAYRVLFSDQLGTTVAVRLITTFGDIQVSSPQAREQTTNHTFGVCNRESVYASVGMQVLI